jgi:hypothetical protein
MEVHNHTFSPSEWPFADAINTLAFTTKRVLHDGYPILLVSHDNDGDWQMLCGTTNDPADGLIICLGCIYERDTSLAQVSDLRLGWQAWRDSPSEPWTRRPLPPEEE